jgi:regulator of cell morphogenesis and NO signaling
MNIRHDSRVADLATDVPATIKVFQQHGIDFCCGGKIPLAEACAGQGLDVDAIITELEAATTNGEPQRNWEQLPMADLVAHVQMRFHEPLRAELPRLTEMLAKVVSRHGEHYPETLLPLQRIFDEFRRDMLDHMTKEDMVLFPAIVRLERGLSDQTGAGWVWMTQPIDMMEAEHEDAGRALAEMRRLTAGYAPPTGACPTFRGLYYGLAELEREMHLHVHLENNILFPRAASLAQSR